MIAKKLNCIIIHGCPSNTQKEMDPKTRTYDKHWIPWIKKQLTLKGIKTLAPLMPNPWTPDYEEFKSEFERYAIDKNSILIGHSCGCSFLVRYLTESKKHVHKLILVAPWKIKAGSSKSERAFYEFSIDKTIKDRVKEIIMFTSDNEAEDGKKGLIMFHDALGGKIINLPKHGHYCLGNMGTERFPELLDAAIN